MINRINFEDPLALVQENYAGQYPRQMPIVLYISWENDYVEAYTNGSVGSVPGEVWLRRATMIMLPPNVDASELKDDVDRIIPMLESLRKHYTTNWDGHNWIGVFEEEFEDKKSAFIWDLDDRGDEFFTTYDEGGLIDAGDYFDTPDELTAESRLSEIEELALMCEREALEDGYIIAGGVDSIRAWLIWQRDEMEFRAASGTEL